MYNEFARVYDVFMGETPYKKWYNFINTALTQNGISPKIVCDLGCGTGVLCKMFEEDGVEVIGIDGSVDMLAVAKTQSRNVLYLNQDISEFELYGTVDLIYSSCDTLNYLIEPAEIKNVFKLVNNYLEKDGLFIFDINTEYKYKNELGEKVFVEQNDDASYIWENFYDPKEKINEFGVTFFIRDDYIYKKSQEFHYQKAYTIEEIKQYLEEAGLIILGIYDDYTSNMYNPTTSRATFITKEGYLEDKFYQR
ncbi:MAG: hypothetical protein BEN19_06015 [Epulopiscium sp. Nuni2H_MBin003]|nr:MAG: hypothetical protein BEN19_06015 [Epulopiscium sp. Nuni2H_MBin003]